MGTRPAATSIVVSITCSHSSCESVGVSPVVPQGTRKSIPDSTCHATRLRRAVSSKGSYQRCATTTELHGIKIARMKLCGKRSGFLPLGCLLEIYYVIPV